MGASSDPDFDHSVFRAVPEEPPVVIPPTPSSRLRREPLWRYVVLFVLTLLSTTQAGGLHYVSFTTAFSDQIPRMPIFSLLLHDNEPPFDESGQNRWRDTALAQLRGRQSGR